MNTEFIKREKITGARRISNYIWVLILTLGGLGFLLSGISSYIKVNLVPFTDSTQLVFIPQGILLSFSSDCCPLPDPGRVRGARGGPGSRAATPLHGAQAQARPLLGGRGQPGHPAVRHPLP